jgi:hypothetical protein
VEKPRRPRLGTLVRRGRNREEAEKMGGFYGISTSMSTVYCNFFPGRAHDTVCKGVSGV